MNTENNPTGIEFTPAQTKEPEKQSSYQQNIIYAISTWVATLLIVIPLFIIIYKFIPSIKFVIADKYVILLDQVLTFIVIFFLIRLLVKLLKKFVAGIVIMIIVYLTFNLFLHKYSFSDIYKDYKSLVIYLKEEPIKVPFVPESASFRNGIKIRAAIQAENPVVRNFAVVLSLKHFNDPNLYRRYGKVIRYFSIFKDINQRWQYVYDPINSDYYASARESIMHLSGDCDDHSIVMASCIMAVGGEARIVRTVGHLYPEVKICHKQDLVKYNLLIRQLFETEGKDIFFHEDEDGYIWLNFDYTDRYPGGKFMNQKIIGILNL